MKSKRSIEAVIYAVVIVLCVVALVLAFNNHQFTDTKLIYEGF